MRRKRWKSRHGAPPGAANGGRWRTVADRERPDYNGGWGMVFLQTVLLVCAGLLFLEVRGELFDREMSRDSQGWPSTEGVITDARTEVVTRGRARNRREIPVVRYVYRVETKPFSGHRVDFSGDEHFADRAAVLARYPFGARVRVWYRADDPRVSTLEPGGWNSPWKLAIDIVMVVLLAALPVHSLSRRLLRAARSQGARSGG